MPRRNARARAEGEHIFQASQLTPLAVQWKQLTAAGRHKEAMLVMEKIIEGSTALFEWLAQFENFHSTVDLPLLISAAQEKIIVWLTNWQPKKGRLFSWFYKCARNAFLSELVKVNQYRKHFHVTSDNLEKFYGVEDHEVDKHDLAEEINNKLKELTCRWGGYQEINAVKFLTRCILEHNHDRQAALRSIRSAAYAFGLSFDMAKFFYNWAIVNLRHAFYEKVYIPFTEFDLMLAATSYTFWPEVVNIVGIEKAKELCAKLGGQRVRIPSLHYLAKLRNNYRLTREIEQSDLDPDSVAHIAKKHGKTSRAAQEIYNEMVELLDSKHYGEHSLFEEDTPIF